MIAAKFRRMQARHRINQFYVFESGRSISPRVASAAPLNGGADGAIGRSDALKQAAGPREDRIGGLPIFWTSQPSGQ
jgi:hypothetical protein